MRQRAHTDMYSSSRYTVKTELSKYAITDLSQPAAGDSRTGAGELQSHQDSGGASVRLFADLLYAHAPTQVSVDSMRAIKALIFSDRTLITDSDVRDEQVSNLPRLMRALSPPGGGKPTDIAARQILRLM